MFFLSNSMTGTLPVVSVGGEETKTLNTLDIVGFPHMFDTSVQFLNDLHVRLIYFLEFDSYC